MQTLKELKPKKKIVNHQIIPSLKSRNKSKK